MSNKEKKMQLIAAEEDISVLEEMLHTEREDLLTKAYPDPEDRKLAEGRIMLIRKRINELQEDDPDKIKV